MLKNKFFIVSLARRRFLKWAGVLTASSLIPFAFKNKGSKSIWVNEAFAGNVGSSIRAFEPFVDALIAPSPPKPTEPFTDLDPHAGTLGDLDLDKTQFFEVVTEQAFVKIHRDLPLVRVWRYRDKNFPDYPVKAPNTYHDKDGKPVLDEEGNQISQGYLGPTFVAGMGNKRKTLFVRYINELPADPVAADPTDPGFGVPCLSVHYHGAHVEARSDGFPENMEDGPHPFEAPVVFVPEGFLGINPQTLLEFPPPHGEVKFDDMPHQYDYRYDMKDPGFSHVDDGGPPFRPGDERPATQWYHDHLFDFTGPNVIRGPSGLHIVFDELDSGDETDTEVINDGPYAGSGRTPLRLPSGLGIFDIPLVIQDRLFREVEIDGRSTMELEYPPGEHDGYLGDIFLVNGLIQPYFKVKRRKYRFRLLDGSNARFYQLFLTKEHGDTYTFDHIANAGGLFAYTIRDVESVLLSSASRADIVIDFSAYQGGDELYLENRLEQDDGRGPKGKFLDPGILEKGTRLLKFIIEEGDVDDPSQVPSKLRPLKAVADIFTPEEMNNFPRRTFRFDRTHGAWAVNGEFAELSFEGSAAQPKLNTPEIWRFVNKSGGWWHPIHPHSELMRVLSRNGEEPPLEERDGNAKTDTVILGPGDEVEVFLNFRDYPGPWVMHCHTIEHEDMRMMIRFDVVDPDTAVST